MTDSESHAQPGDDLPRPVAGDHSPDDGPIEPGEPPETPDWVETFIKLHRRTLMVALFSFGGLFLLSAIMPRPNPNDPPPPSLTSNIFQAAGDANWIERQPLPVKVVMGFMGALNLCGITLFITAAVMMSQSPEWHARLRPKTIIERRQPAVYFLDLVAALLAVSFLAPAFSLVLRAAEPAGWHVPTSQGVVAAGAPGLLVDLLAMFAAYAGTVVLLVWCARGRAADGAEGLWPIWRNRRAKGTGSLGRDILEGIAFYVLFSWVFWLANLINNMVLKAKGRDIDINPLLEYMADEARGAGRVWVIVGLVVAAAVGAAVFEEILFRGLLYNVCKRYMGGWLAAILAALIFSLIHRVEANILSLFLMGLVLIWLYERTGRLTASIVFHLVNNAVAATMAAVLAYYAQP